MSNMYLRMRLCLLPHYAKYSLAWTSACESFSWGLIKTVGFSWIKGAHHDNVHIHVWEYMQEKIAFNIIVLLPPAQWEGQSFQIYIYKKKKSIVF